MVEGRKECLRVCKECVTLAAIEISNNEETDE
jgi:hypothetical protein